MTVNRATILIVDDDVANIEIMNAALEAEYDVCFASCGEDALEVARVVQPDLVLLDVLMPGIDGFEACRKFKMDPVLADVPVIFTTGLGDSEAEMRGLSLGAIDYIAKPVQPALLRARVANHVELKRMRDRLAEMAVTDALTGLSNRRHLEINLAADCGRLVRDGDWLSIIMVDIDFFKQFNDTYGHQAGDRCITMIASALTRALRNLGGTPGDVSGKAARYGGEEFLCALPGADPQAAGEVALEIKRQVDALGIPHKTSRIGPQVTVSIGVACARCRDGMTPDHWIAAADAQLYKSKSYGRDRVTLHCFEGATPN